MNFFEFPFESYTILALAGILTVIYFIILVYVLQLDKSENAKCKLEFLQNDINQTDHLYSLSITIQDCFCIEGISDIIFRIRGSERDSPLIFYRNQNKLKSPAILNIGLALPFSLGNVLQIDIASDNNLCEENKPILSITDIFVRKLPNDPEASRMCKKKRFLSSLFLTFSEDFTLWVCVETITSRKGLGISGFSKFQRGKAFTLRARDACLSLPLVKENERLKVWYKIGYRPLHYLCSLSPKWHNAWSDYSRFDQVMIMFLDQLALIVVISILFAFAIESHFGVTMVKEALKNYLKIQTFAEIEMFNFFQIFSPSKKGWFLYNALNLIHIVWISLISSFLIIPFSLAFCRLFRFVGGKNFEENISVCRVNNMKKSWPVEKTITSSLMLRTLECRSVHTGFSVTSSRRLRTEPMICNCPPNQISPRVIAYVRTKMARLREDSEQTGLSEPKGLKVLHESHTQTTDAPHMPLPTAATASANGNEGVTVVARYCERLVQQASEHIRDRSVIAECLELSQDLPVSGTPRTDVQSLSSCCPRQCRIQNKKCRQESLSNSNFFSEEDAASVKEMISNFSLNDTFKEELKQPESLKKKSKVASNKKQRKPSKSAVEKNGSFSSPAPSAGISKTPQSSTRKAHSSSAKAVTFRNSGTETKISKDAKMTKAPNQSRASTVKSRGRTFRRSFSCPSILIGRERTAAAETGVTWKKVRSRLYDAVAFKLRSTDVRKNNNVPFPSASNPCDFGFSEDESKSCDLQSINSERRKFVCKGVKLKMLIFFFLLLFLNLAIYFLTAFDGSNNYLFVARSTEKSPRKGRLHAATLSCLLSLLLYYILTIHLIALLSFLIEILVFACFSKKNVNSQSYYKSKSQFSVV